MLTLVALASMPALAAYNASKAAAPSLTQSFRADLGKRGITVHGVFPGRACAKRQASWRFKCASSAATDRQTARLGRQGPEP